MKLYRLLSQKKTERRALACTPFGFQDLLPLDGVLFMYLGIDNIQFHFIG